jgi:hypothetical protein
MEYEFVHVQEPLFTSFHVLIKLCPAGITVLSGMVISMGFPAAAWSHNTVGVSVWITTPVVGVISGDGPGGVGVWVRGTVGEGVSVCLVVVAEAVSWLFTIAPIVALICVWFGVAVLMGMLPEEMRLMICHKMKMTPAATSNHTKAVNTPKRIGVRFLVDTD